MDLKKWINNFLNIVLEDFRYQYEKEIFYPSPLMVQNIAKAYDYIQTNNLAGGTGGNEGSGLNKAKSILNKEPINHSQLKRMKAYFDNNYDIVKQEKASGKNITNSGLIQSWELWGGDAGRDWVNQKINTVNNKNDRSKTLRPKGTKNLMNPHNTRTHGFKSYTSEANNKN